jgi:hypothetical protein
MGENATHNNVPQKTSRLAILSLSVAILGALLVVLFLGYLVAAYFRPGVASYISPKIQFGILVSISLLGPAAFVLSFIALDEIGKSTPRIGGEDLAATAFGINYVALLFVCFLSALMPLRTYHPAEPTRVDTVETIPDADPMMWDTPYTDRRESGRQYTVEERPREQIPYCEE